MIEHLFDSIKVEVIADVFLIDLAEELVVLQIAEPVYPSDGFFRTV